MLAAKFASIGIDKDYAGMDFAGLKFDPQGWGDAHPIFRRLMEQLRPSTVIEVGAWKGASLLRMAGVAAELSLETEFISIDTWLGSHVDLWMGYRGDLLLKHGFPTMFRQFIFNMIAAEVIDRVWPMPMTTTAAAAVLARMNVQADLIYIDAAHDEEDVTLDIQRFWPLLRPGGVMFGDDYSENWPGVMAAADRFAIANGLELTVDAEKWSLTKPGEQSSPAASSQDLDAFAEDCNAQPDAVEADTLSDLDERVEAGGGRSLRLEVDAGLIFDLGLHQGKDAAFYLAKGFRVMGLEAVPSIAEATSERLREYCDDGRLAVETKALDQSAGETVSFFVVPGKDDWGSLTKAGAEKGDTPAVEISVETTTLGELFDRYGTPYYIKCDIEGADLIFRDQLLADDRRPVFVSLECNEPADLDVLQACGYELVQIVNQSLNVSTSAPFPAREGQYVDARFDGHTSGLFGRELPANGWISFDEARERLGLYQRLKSLDDNLAPGWIDLHVCRRQALG